MIDSIIYTYYLRTGTLGVRVIRAMGKMLSFSIAEKYVTLKSLKQNYMMDRSEVIVTINADILNEQVWYLCIIV